MLARPMLSNGAMCTESTDGLSEVMMVFLELPSDTYVSMDATLHLKRTSR